MEDAQLPTPHNNFFRYAFSHASAVRSLIETHLPGSVTRALDLSTLELQKDSFIDPRLRESHSDLLYSVQTEDPTADHSDANREALVYILLEHKSTPDEMTCFQLLRYIVRIWEQRQRNGQPLCPVIPLVIYHGEAAWSAPRSLDELIDAPDMLLEYGIRFAFPMLDLGQIPDDSLATEPFLQSVLHLLKYGRRQELAERLERILRWLLESGTTNFRKEHLDAVMIYIMATSQAIPIETLSMTVQKIFPTQIEPGSIADKLLQEGREEGEIKGEIKGEIRIIRTLQEILGGAVCEASILQGKSLEELQAMTAELRSQIQKRT